MQRKGRWFWEPPARLRRSHGLKVAALGADTVLAWQTAHQLNKNLARLEPDAPAVGTAAWLFEEFFRTERFKGLAASTQGDYRWLAKRLRQLVVGQMAFGRYPARSVKARHADKIYELLTTQGGTTAAHYACRFARRVWKWAGRKEFVDPHPNPWSGMELPTIAARDQRWQRSQVLAVVAKAKELARPSMGLAILLAYELGHRQSDVLSLTWTDLDRRQRRTRKTGVVLPVLTAPYPELAAMLAETKEARGSLPSTHVLVCETTRMPWQPDFFRHEFRRIATAAGIPADLQFRDLRATAATELADAGADDIESTTHTGHLTAQMRRRYARRTPTQFESAARKRIAARERPSDE
jgi:integrase